MKSRKLTVFVVNAAILTGIYALTALFAGAQLPAVGPTIIIMLVTNGFAYIGGNVAHAWQKSKYFQGDLVEK